jgi:hypothetical protein
MRMRASAPLGDEPSLEMRLAQLDAQLRAFDVAMRAQQQGQGRIADRERELAAVVERGARLVRDLAATGDQLRQRIEAVTGDALTASAAHLQDFEQRAGRILSAYGDAVRAAQQAVARAEARIESFDERVGHELGVAAREIREAAALLRERPVDPAADSTEPVSASRARRLIPALLAAALLLAGFAAYSWVTRTLNEASARADAAERQAGETRREANQQIASIERTAEQSSRQALSAAARAERMANVLAAPDARRTPLRALSRAAGADGQVLWSPAHGALITATNLPSLSNNESYQAWVVTSQGVSSLGLLNAAAGRGTGAFDLPAGTAGTIRGFMVTREPAGGRERPSRVVVLASY